MSICRLHHLLFYLLHQPWALEKPNFPSAASSWKQRSFFHIWYHLSTCAGRKTDIQIAPCICLDTGRGHGWCRLNFLCQSYRLTGSAASFTDWYPSVIFEITCQELSLNRYHTVIKKIKSRNTSWTQIKSVRGDLWRETHPDMKISRKPQRKSLLNCLNYFILRSCWT